MTSMVALVVLVVIATLIGNLNGYNLLLNAINNRNAAHKHYELDYFKRSQKDEKTCIGFLVLDDAEPMHPPTHVSYSRYKDCLKSKNASIQCSQKNHRITCFVLASMWNNLFPCDGGHYTCYRDKLIDSTGPKLPICVCDREKAGNQCKQQVSITKKCTIDGRTDCECVETMKLLPLPSV